jgi:hypothetical protein
MVCHWTRGELIYLHEKCQTPTSGKRQIVEQELRSFGDYCWIDSREYSCSLPQHRWHILFDDSEIKPVSESAAKLTGIDMKVRNM